ncbi:RND transporter [Tropicibacter sp. S64]|uniref:RND transporter n=1 Tax=Tropicibacter sp. S64 TaxID=3415122 RepID=UPI003C7CE04E
MSGLRRVLDALPWPLLLFLCVTLGLAPFVPEPHFSEKFRMLLAGDLTRPTDLFDFGLHGLPWLFLLLKLMLGHKRPD